MSLQLLADELSGVTPVVVGDIARVEAAEERVVLSLIQVGHEPAMRNPVIPGRGVSKEVQAPAGLVLRLLFSACHADYGSALDAVGAVIVRLHERSVFTGAQGFRLELALQPLSLADAYHLWGALGVRQVPYAFYHARLIPQSW